MTNRFLAKQEAKREAPILSAAKLRVQSYMPYFSSLLFSLRPVPVPNLRKKSEIQCYIAVDKNLNLYFDPVELENYTVEEISADLVHEMNHILRRHFARREASNLDNAKWNTAGDFAINVDMRIDLETVYHGDPPYKMAADYMFPGPDLPKSKMSAERYYELIKSWPQRKSCGSCACGVLQPWELKETEDTITPAEVDNLIHVTCDAISQYPGNIPAHLKKLAESLYTSKIPWQRVLRYHISKAMTWCEGQVDFTYTRRNRRQYLYKDVLMPVLRGKKAKVAVLIDISGSMGPREMAMALSETASILRAHKGIKIHLIAGDTVPTFNAEINSITQLRNMKGGGGTRIAPLYVAAAEVQPDIVILITDGWVMDWPKDPIPNTKNIVVLAGTTARVPEWAQKITVERRGDEK